MILEYFWLVVLIGVVLWYVIVTILVAQKGFTSLKTMLAELAQEDLDDNSGV
jgi:hypothetical protein